MSDNLIPKEKETVDFESGTCVNKENLIEDSEAELIASLKKEIDKKNEEKTNKKNWKKTLIWVVSVVLIIGIISYCGIMFAFDFLGLGSSKKVDINIPQGSSAAQIADILEDAGIVRSGLFFRVYSKLKGYDSGFKYGVYVFSADMSYERIAQKLTEEGERAEAVKVTIPEGSTIDEIAEILETKGICTVKDFKKALRHEDYDYDFIELIPNDVYYKLEGYLFPDTYYFYNYGGEDCAHRAIDVMLGNFNDKFSTEMRKAAASRGYSIHDIVTISSIIELEAGNASYENKQKVSAVFFNRLAWTTEPPLLGSSPTAEYPYGDGKYNTNEYPGLPPGPLCAPSLDSIKAAVEPMANFEADFFVTDKNMQFYYTNSYEEHKAIIQELKNKGLWA